MSVLLSHKRSLKIKIKVYVIRLYNGPARELRTEWQSHWMTVSLYDNTTEQSGPELCQAQEKLELAKPALLCKTLTR